MKLIQMSPNFANRRRLFHYLRIVLLWLTVALIAFPVYWMFVTSIETPEAYLKHPPQILPLSGLTFRNFQTVLSGKIGGARESSGIVTWLKNSLIVSGCETLCILLLSAIGGYALARSGFPLKNIIGKLIFILYLTPGLVLVVSLFVLAVSLKMNNSLVGLIIIESGMLIPISLWLARSFFISLPIEVEEAALTDGCSRWQMIWKVVFPMALPGMVVIGFNSFLTSWNSYLLPSVLINNNSLKTLPVGLLLFFQVDAGIIWGEMMAAGIISTIPVLFLAMYFQKYIISGITVGAVKG